MKVIEIEVRVGIGETLEIGNEVQAIGVEVTIEKDMIHVIKKIDDHEMINPARGLEKEVMVVHVVAVLIVLT